MKATGVVRRIDDLGRIVIPKEIRKVLRIKEGDPLEVFTDREGQVILKKYSDPNFVTELDKITSDSLKYMDIDGDGLLSANDAALVLSMVLDPTAGPAV